jgi:DNA-binding ferritin-like protein
MTSQTTSKTEVPGKFSEQIEQVRNLREICRLMVEQQEKMLKLISDKLDELEADLSDSNKKHGGEDANGE